jgi:hypothetical protein
MHCSIVHQTPANDGFAIERESQALELKMTCDVDVTSCVLTDAIAA